VNFLVKSVVYLSFWRWKNAGTGARKLELAQVTKLVTLVKHLPI